MPNRRRRRLSTAMSAVAALAVASPAAVVAVSDLSDSIKPPTQHRQFVQAAMITDLPNELMSALSQGLSQFDAEISIPTRANEDAKRKDAEAVVAKLAAAEKTEKDKF